MERSEAREEFYSLGVGHMGSPPFHRLGEDREAAHPFSFSHGHNVHRPLSLYNQTASLSSSSENRRGNYTRPTLPVSPLSFQSAGLTPPLTGDYWPGSGIVNHPPALFPLSWSHGIGYPGLVAGQYGMGVDDARSWKRRDSSYTKDESFQNSSFPFDGGIRRLSCPEYLPKNSPVCSQSYSMEAWRSATTANAVSVEPTSSQGRATEVLPTPGNEEDACSAESADYNDTVSDDDMKDEQWKDGESTDNSSEANEAQQLVIDEPAGCPAATSLNLKLQSQQHEVSAATIPRKRRKINDESEVRRPLDLGWGRQVRLKHLPNGVCKSEVYYIAPCGKKLRTYPDVNRYLQQLGTTNLMPSDFSFSAKIYLGEFFESNGGDYEKLSESDLERRRYVSQDAKREREARAKGKKRSKGCDDDKVEQQTDLNQKLPQVKFQRHERRKTKASKDKNKQLREDEQMKRKQEITLRKLEDAARKAKEKELKKQQAAIEKEEKRQLLLQLKERQRIEAATMKAHEREVKRQQALALKAEEAQRKALAREKMKEEKEIEKQRLKELKAGRKRLTAAMMNDSSQPCDDLYLHHPKPLPCFDPMGIPMTSVAFGDSLMVVEFLWTFCDAFSLEVLPTVGSLQAGLLNQQPYAELLLDICLQMVDIIIHDSSCGVHHCASVMGTLLSSLKVTEKTFSETLRIILETKDNNGAVDIVDLLSRHTFLSLTAEHKAYVLGFLVNELLTSRVILRIIDGRQEKMAELRRCKWKIQCKIRKVRQAINERYPSEPSPEGKHPGRRPKSVAAAAEGDDDDDDEEEDGSDDEEDAGDDSEGLSDVDMNDVERTCIPHSKEELDHEMSKLEKWQHLYRQKLHAAMRSMRTMSFGVDRYSRRYWSVPYCGGVFVEGVDSEEAKNGMWWTQSQPISISSRESLVETKPLLPLPPLIKLPIPMQDDFHEKLGHDSHHSRRKHRLHQVRLDRYHRGNASSVEESVNTQFSEDGSENEGNSLSEGKTIHLYGRISSYNPFHCNLLWVREQLSKDPTVARPIAICPPQTLDAVKPELSAVNSFASHNFTSDSSSSDNHELSLLAAVATSQREHENQKLQPTDEHYIKANDRTDTKQSSGLITTSVLTLASETLKAVKAAEKAKAHSHKTRSLNTNNLLPSLSLVTSNNHITNDIFKRTQPVAVSKDTNHGWWMVKEGDEMRSLFKSLCTKGFREHSLRKVLSKNLEYICRSCGKGVKDLMIPEDADEIDEDTQEMVGGRCTEKEHGVDYPQETVSASLVLLNDIQELEDRLLSASLQSKGWKPRSVGEDSEEEGVVDTRSAPNCLRSAIERLLALEEAVERRYLKPPLRDIKPLTASALNARVLGCVDEGQSAECEDREMESVPLGLGCWRDAVSTASSAAQVTLCCNQLDQCIAWEKSIMKVFCQVCLKGDNEALLLLCDGCEKGVHTYCCKPKLSGIPDGDWYCHLCVENAAGDDRCIVCSASSTTGRMIRCGHCPRQYHMKCLDPPMSRLPKEVWCCPICSKQMESSRASAEQLNLDVEDLIQQSNSRPAKRNRNNDMGICRTLLRDLEKQQESWPFLTPVARKQVPSYYQIIKNPMNFQTIRNKMKGNQYLSREAFAADVRLIFDNCRTFNEDDSEVGKSGLILGRYFEKRWRELNRGNVF